MNGSVQFSVTTRDRRIAFDILESKSSKNNKKLDGAEISFVKGTIHEAVSFPETYTFLIYITEGAVLGTAVTLLGNYLYDKLKNSDAKLKIEGMEIHIDKGEIERILIEKLEKS